ncbi:hypothetical protein [Desulfofarcimen acetoxidans]|uniref:hypothetical protein n=1 Tax=Desulfofarcimen acetoxidans TaxID=58138 RepID=UPI00019E4B92|nr:hypothetical protein [Desulfofarcimen acetoxidans]
MNVLLGIGGVGILWRFKGGAKKNNSRYSKGLKNVDNAAFGTSRWASRDDIKHLCEFGAPLVPKK